MDSRERIRLAIGHREADRIPTGEIIIVDELVRACLGAERIGFPERKEFVNRLGIDAICESPQWRPSPSPLPDPGAVRWKDLDSWATHTDRFIFVILDGVFGWGMKLLGFEQFLTSSLRRSTDLIELLEQVEQLNIDLAKRAVEAGATGVLIADDIAYRRGTMVDPGLLRELFFPSLGRQLDAIASTRTPVFFHSDGNLNAVVDDLVGIGFQGLHCLDPEAGMDLTQLKARYGKKICLWGNLDPKSLFLAQDGEALKRKVNNIFSVAAPGGGFIFGTTSGLVDGMRPENIEAVYRVARSQGRH